MTDSSFLPEQQLTVSPGLAATIGLEEAVLLQYLASLFSHHAAQRRGDRDWLRIERRHLASALPFWNSGDLQRICHNLVETGVLLVHPESLSDSDQLVYAINESPAGTAPRAPAPATAAPPPEVTPRAHAGLLPASWHPSEDMLQLLAMNHNISRQFAIDQLEDFVLYWRERGEASHAWENKFRQHVLSNWRRSQQDSAATFTPPEQPLDGRWRPSADAMEIMLRAGVSREFIDEAIPEFILFWRERGTAPRELNSRFVQHIRLQWTKYTSSLQHSTEPRRLPEDWQPSEDVMDILRMSHIDADFALRLLPEFLMYWRDSNQLHTSWNSKFLQHVKYHWARHNKMSSEGADHGGQQGSPGTGRTRDRSLEQDLSDTSWAD